MLIAAIEDPGVASRILECLDLPARAPPLVPAAVESPEPDPPEVNDWPFDPPPAPNEA
jgi:hypothetical protein